jgi:hypothetical protein
MQGKEHHSICHIPSLHGIFPHVDVNQVVHYAHAIYQFGCQHVARRN